MNRPKTFAEAEQVLAQTLPGYTPRAEQQAAAAFVEEMIANQGHGLVEAGCGTGKSLATMIPAILNGRKTVVATATIALMEQYANKDVPFLQQNLGVPFTYALVKGRSNYLCRAKVNDVDPTKVPNLAAMLKEIEETPDHTGDREHFTTPVTADEFSWLTTTSAECPGKRECPFGEICFAEKAKEKGKAAQVVVTNTAMLLTDLKVREVTGGNANMLGEYDQVIIDEAHEVEDYATNALREEIKEAGVRRLVAESENWARSQGANLTKGGAVAQALTEVWDLLPEGQMTLRYFVEQADTFINLLEALEEFGEEIGNVEARDQKNEAKRALLVQRASNYRVRFHDAMTADDHAMVRWTEAKTDKRNNTVKSFNTAPISVGEYLAEWLWDQVPSVLVSATLSVNGDFSYIAERLGLPGSTETLSVGTPFDYEKQAALFVPPRNAPSPKEKITWSKYAVQTTKDLIAAAGGGALLLFTSRSSMRATHEALAPWLREQGYTPLMQDLDGTKKELAERFQADTNSVLFGLKSFMTGVDFQGESCRLVVIDKLPFPVPTEAIFSARAAEIDRNGGSSFRRLTIPIMTLTLEQAYGRLIRTSEDRGIVAILDSRLSSTPYGRQIVKALPDSPVYNNLSEVQEFFS